MTDHQSADLFSQLHRLLPSLPSHSVDVKIDLTPLVPKKKSKDNKGDPEVKTETDLKGLESDKTSVEKTVEEANASEDEEAEEDSPMTSLFGCLSHPREEESARLLPSLLRLKSKDALNLLLMTLRKRSNDIRRKRGEKESAPEDEGKIAFEIFMS